MTHNKRLTDKLMDIARWYSMPADHFNVVKEAVKILQDAPSTDGSENPSYNSIKIELDLIQRQDAYKCLEFKGDYDTLNEAYERLSKLLPVSKEKTGRCKDCKWWKDSDGVYRRGVRAESLCPINHREVFEGNAYCYMFEQKMQEVEE